jgi:hypothetical protein
LQFRKLLQKLVIGSLLLPHAPNWNTLLLQGTCIAMQKVPATHMLRAAYLDGVFQNGSTGAGVKNTLVEGMYLYSE